jgi:hypothetical protein
VNHHAGKKFWKYYRQLPESVRRIADENYELLKRDPSHPSLHFKNIGGFWSVRIGIHYRALAVQHESDLVWFWIGHHRNYDRLISKRD